MVLPITATSAETSTGCLLSAQKVELEADVALPGHPGSPYTGNANLIAVVYPTSATSVANFMLNLFILK